MKPLNLDNRPCNPISSNCVIWQGPDIPCINLCAGDSVSDVVFKLATELCIIMDQLNVSNYDLSCLSLTSCPPENFQALIQLLINKVCAANGITTDIRVDSTCPDCVVSVAPCFVQGTQTTMQLTDYVQMIGNRICSILDEITNINSELEIINNTLIDLQNQIDDIPTYTLPSIPADCILAPGNYPLDQILNALLNDGSLGYCSLLSATGTPSEIINSVLTQCIVDGDPSLASLAAGDSPVQSFSTYYSGTWVNNPVLTASPTAANAIKNIWIAICDMYNYLQSGTLDVVDTNTINLTYTGNTLQAAIQDTGWVFLQGFDYYTGSMASQRPQCRRIGNVIHFRGTVVFPLSSTSNGLTLVPLSTATAYNNQPYPYTYGNTAGTLPNGTQLDTNGSVSFNNNTSCIPSTVWAGALDGTYGLGWVIATRQINVDADYGAALSATLNVLVNSSGVLLAATVKDTELSTTRPNGMRGTSSLRFINTNIRTEQVIPNFINADTNIHNLPAPGVSNLVAESEFTSQPVGSPPTPVTVPSLNWPFSCDSGEETDLGGFSFRLDGLMTYVSPCAATGPTPVPCT
jgi:hypothetical protein